VSRENVELVRSVHPPSGTDLLSLFSEEMEASGVLRGMSALVTPDFEAIGGDLSGGGITAGGRGIEGLWAAWRDWLRPWGTYWTEVDDFIDAGDERVVVLTRDHGRLRGSDSEVEAVGASVWTLREAKIVRIEFYLNRNEALKAVGLEE
jgi:ketosteroid isomerase-like protein